MCSPGNAHLFLRFYASLPSRILYSLSLVRVSNTPSSSPSPFSTLLVSLSLYCLSFPLILSSPFPLAASFTATISPLCLKASSLNSPTLSACKWANYNTYSIVWFVWYTCTVIIVVILLYESRTEDLSRSVLNIGWSVGWLSLIILIVISIKCVRHSLSSYPLYVRLSKFI